MVSGGGGGGLGGELGVVLAVGGIAQAVAVAESLDGSLFVVPDGKLVMFWVGCLVAGCSLFLGSLWDCLVPEGGVRSGGAGSLSEGPGDPVGWGPPGSVVLSGKG